MSPRVANWRAGKASPSLERQRKSSRAAHCQLDRHFSWFLRAPLDVLSLGVQWACSPQGLGFHRFWRRSAIISSSFSVSSSGLLPDPAWSFLLCPLCLLIPTRISHLFFCPVLQAIFPSCVLACASRLLFFQFNNYIFYFCISITFKPTVFPQKSILASLILFLLSSL